VDASGTFTPAPVPDGAVALKVTVGGLKGGHSGMDINAGRANANKMLARLLDGVAEQPDLDVRLASISGGERYNAIPLEASMVVTIPADAMAGFAAWVSAFGGAVAAEYAVGDPGLTIIVEDAPMPNDVLRPDDQQRLVMALRAAPNGVVRMSDAVKGMVETSTNLGVLQLANGAWTAGFYLRSAVDSERDDLAASMTDVFTLAGLEAEIRDSYSGWAPNPGSEILGLMTGVYRDLFGTDPEIASVHAGLETSVLGARIPGLDMISVGPTLIGVHAPGERLEVVSVPKEYALLSATLAAIPPA
jgi:dipeptidase D